MVAGRARPPVRARPGLHQRYGGAYSRPPSLQSWFSAALEPERREVPLVDLRVVPDLTHDLVRKVGGQTEARIEHRAIDLDAEELPDRRIGCAIPLRVDVLRCEPELLGLDRRENRPVDRLRPLRVAVADCGREWFLGEGVGQDHKRVRSVGIAGAQARELAAVGRPAVAPAFLERACSNATSSNDNTSGGASSRRGELVATLPSVVVPPATHDLPRQVGQRGDAGIGCDHHPLAVVEVRV